MQLTVRQLQALVAIAENSILSRAADDMCITQPALSRLLNQVEKNYQVRLFERRGRAGMIPTELGRQFVEHARKIIREYDAIEIDFETSKGQPAGRINIAMTDNVAHMLCVPAIKHFKSQYPLIRLRIVSALSAEIPQQVYSGKVQLGIISDTHKIKGLKVRPIFREKLQLVGPPGSIMQNKDSIDLAQVARLPLVLPAMDGSIREHIDRAFADNKLLPKIEFEVDTQEGILDLVKAGEGFSIMSFAGVHRYILAGELAACEISSPEIERAFSIATASNKPRSLLVQTVENELLALIDQFSESAKWVRH